MTSEKDIERRERRRRLAAALAIGCEAAKEWAPEDLAVLFQHQLDAPVVVDLSILDPNTATRLAILAQSKALLLRSFRDLLVHSSPPIELLRLTKDFAKANCGSAKSVLPQPVATVFYYAAIAAALVHCGERITKLENRKLAGGFRWSAAQTWVGGKIKGLLEEATCIVEPS